MADPVGPERCLASSRYRLLGGQRPWRRCGTSGSCSSTPQLDGTRMKPDKVPAVRESMAGAFYFAPFCFSKSFCGINRQDPGKEAPSSLTAEEEEHVFFHPSSLHSCFFLNTEMLRYFRDIATFAQFWQFGTERVPIAFPAPAAGWCLKRQRAIGYM